MEEILHQLRLVVYPVIHKVYVSHVQDFFYQPYQFQEIVDLIW